MRRLKDGGNHASASARPSRFHTAACFDIPPKALSLSTPSTLDDGFYANSRFLHSRLIENIYLQFVVDEEWTTDHTVPQENDGSNNINNVLTPEQISKAQDSTDKPVAIMSGVTPQSTTTNLAANVPKEASRDQERVGSSDLPGSFPETPAVEPSEFSINPIPATSGLGNPINLPAGEKVPEPSTLTSNTVSSTARDDPSLAQRDEDAQQTFGVSPLPATSGLGNPIHLRHGEKVPDSNTFTNNTVLSTVTTDKGSYESSSGAPQLPDVVTPQNERDERGGGMFNLPGISNNMIPESSLPMGQDSSLDRDPGFTIQSAGPQTSTAGLASKVPLESRGVPEIVQESQVKAGFDPEASGSPEAVKEKSEMEKELESKVPEEAPTTEGISTGEGGPSKNNALSSGEIAGITAGGVGATAAAAMVADHSSKEGTSEKPSSLPSRGLPPSIQQSIDEMNKGIAIAPEVPDVVQESIVESHQSPEAAANEDMVSGKSAVESEFMDKVKTEDARGEPAPSTSAALSESAPAPTSMSSESAKAASAPNSQPSEPAMATAAPSSMPLEQPTNTQDTSSMPSSTTLNAPAAAPATTPAARNAINQAVDSRDVSPMSRSPGTSTQATPTVTTGVGSSSAPPVSQASPTAIRKTETTPAAATSSKASPVGSKNAESSASASADKKHKRASGFFGKLKQKFSDKDKK